MSRAGCYVRSSLDCAKVLRRAFAAFVCGPYCTRSGPRALCLRFSARLPRFGAVLGSFRGHFSLDLQVDELLRRKKADSHETLPLCSETGLGPLANDPEFDRKSLRGPPAKRSTKRSLGKVAPGPPKGVLGSIREPSGRSGSTSGCPGEFRSPSRCLLGVSPRCPGSPKIAPRTPGTVFKQF